MSRYVDALPTGTLIVRSVDGMKKIMACMSGKYKYIPQSILLDVITNFKSSLGDAECKYWNISQFFTNILIEFPEVADDISRTYKLPHRVVPGILLRTSDTGDSSLTAVGTMSIGTSLMHCDTVSRKHSGEIDFGKLKKEIDNEIFKNYTKLPERLCELMLIDVEDPVLCTDYVLEKLNIEDILGKRQAAKLATELTSEYNPSISYSAYDIAVSIMEIPERLQGLSKSSLSQIAKTVSKAAYVDYVDYESSITLVA
jgi:hypothetical protein